MPATDWPSTSTRPAGSTTPRRVDPIGSGCRRTTPAPATPTTPTAPRWRRKATTAPLLLLLLILLTCSPPSAHACDRHHDDPAAAQPTTPWPDTVSPATRRRLLARAATPDLPHPWEHPLGVDRHGRRRSLLSSTLRRCGTHAPEPATRQRLERTHAVRAAREAAYVPSGGDANADNNTPRTIEVPTYVTIVLRDSDGQQLVSDATVHAQLDVLNKAYGTTPNSPVKWSFVLKALVRVKAPAGSGAAGMCDQKIEAKVKKERRQGGPGALNLYIADLSDCGLLGFSSWPWDLSSKGEAEDGVVAHMATLPSGTYKPYNMGYTSVHEIGHWFGLYHTFQNGCTGAGDSVEDTNYVATPTEGCPRARDTCSQPGGDPVTNPMDYTDDACMQAFTVVSF
jgi:hypothetical protein